MYIRDIYEDCRSITKYSDEARNFSRITDAVEVLSNKGNFDALLGYVDIPFTDYLITLPRIVEVPLEVNIDNNPAFTRDRFYEFTLNGPGSTSVRTGWQWEDNGTTPLFFPIPVASTKLTTVSVLADNGKTLTVNGLDNNQRMVQEILTLSSTSPQQTQNVFSDVLDVHKDVTTQAVTLATSPGGVVLATYLKEDTDPLYRRIRVSKPSGTAHILFRRNRFKVNSQDDFIPIRSKMGLIYMIKALEAYRVENVQLAESLEAVAIKLANEEQKVHNSHIDAASESEAATILNSQTSLGDSLIVADIYDEACKIVGPIGINKVFERITEAVQTLSNKGNFDAMLGYYKIKTDKPDGTIITLPDDIEVPLKVNIDDTPAFARDKFYEFTQNGPGSNTERVGWSWEDKGQVPLFYDLPVPSRITFASDPADDGKGINLSGRDSFEIWNGERLILDSDTPPVSANIYSSIISFTKEVTEQPVWTYTSPDAVLLDYHLGPETSHAYRRIKISKPGATAYILFRRKRYSVSSLREGLPIKSRIGLIYMLKALQAYREEKIDVGQKLEEQAIKFANEEQKSNDAFIDMASESEDASIRNLNYNNRDTIIVSDVYDEACKVVGPIGQQKVFDKLTEAAHVLSAKGQWDAQRGYVDIATDQYSYVTLPRYVDEVIELNINNRPAEMKSKWFEFNQGGPGNCWLPCQSWMDAGTVVTHRDVLYPQKLVVIPDLDADLTVPFRVFGYYKGKRISSLNVQGVAIDGFMVIPSGDGDFGSMQIVDRIERITKGVSSGYMRLLGRDLNGENEVQLGYYWPDETEPQYKRIKLSQGCSRVRIMYRRRELKFTALTDPMHLGSKTAILTMLRSIELLNSGKIGEAEAMEQKAVKMLLEDYMIHNQSETPTIDFGGSFNQASDQFVSWA